MKLVIVHGQRRILESVQAIAEADQASLDQRLQAVNQAVHAKFGDEPGGYCYAREVFDDYAIIAKGDKLWRVDYTVGEDGTVSLAGDLQQVKQVYQPVGEGARFDGSVLGPLGDDGKPFVAREAEGGAAPATPDGRKWGVLIIEEGMSKNRNRYKGKVLAEAAPLYNNAPAFIDHVESTGPFGRSGRDKIGFYKDPRPVLLATEGAQGTASVGIAATLVVTRAALRQEMVESWQDGHELFGLSHSIQGEGVTAVEEGGGPFYDVTKITKVESVDLVINPAAGGRLMRLVAGGGPASTLEGDGRMLQKMIESIMASGNADAIAALKALGVTPTEDGVIAIYQEAMKAKPTPAPALTPPPAPRQEAVVPPTDNAFRLTEAQWVADRKERARDILAGLIGGTSLPDLVKDSLRVTFEGQIEAAATEAAIPTRAQMTAQFASQVELFGKLADAKIVVDGSRPRIEVMESARQKTAQRFDDFFDPNKPAQSIREMYLDLTGDKGFTGKITPEVQARLTESIGSTTFDQAMGDAITRRMLAEYKLQVDLNNWEGVIADVVPLSDFRTQRRIRMGGYGNLPLVGQGAPYLQLTTPSDEEATYAPAKRGGTESVTLEAIQNDDIGIIRRIPQRLARAAAQTLHEFVWDFLANNSLVYDGVALAAVGHGNIVTSALSSSNLSSLRLKLKQQTDMTNGKRLGLKSSHLIIPSELEELAWQYATAAVMLPDSGLAAQAASGAPNPVQRQGLKITVVDYWTDTNNYWITADPSQGPMMEIGFLNGRREPEIFVQDLPNVGSLFSHDAITWKIRHIYGGGVLDYRLFAGGIVA